MTLLLLDIVCFFGFMLLVVGVSLYVSRRERTSEDYFLAGRHLGWVIIGISLIASNISTEHFVAMAGDAFGDAGLSIAVYEWHSGIALVVVAWWLLPVFLKAGIFTMPEFLEYRYSEGTRSIMAVYMLVAYAVVLLAVVLYSGGQALVTVFDFPSYLAGAEPTTEELNAANWQALLITIWAVAFVASIYTVYGGLTAVVWSDLLQGGALLLGGALVLVLCLLKLGDGSVLTGWQTFVSDPAVEPKLHVGKPIDHKSVPWLGVMTGLWVPVFFYWGLNQFITQRTLAAKSLAEGQKGIFLATFIKLLIPFIIVFPGIMAFQLYGDEILALGDKPAEKAYPFLISQLLPEGLRGIMMAALCGAILSTFNSGLNSASTVFTLDIYRKYLDPTASERRQVLVGRIATALVAVLACIWAPIIASFESIFQYIQEIWGFISPGILAVFVVGLLVPRTPAVAAKAALLLGPVLYAFLRVPGWVLSDQAQGLWASYYKFSSMSFLYHLAMVFGALVVLMLVITLVAPLKEPRVLPTSQVNITPWRYQYPVGLALMAATVALYVYFW